MLSVRSPRATDDVARAICWTERTVARVSVTARVHNTNDTRAATVPTVRLVRSASARYRSNQTWNALGTIPLDDGVPQIRDLLPQWAHELEGMGTVQVNAEGDLRTIRTNANSKDLTLYSFSDELSYGIQLRDFSLEGNATINDSPVITAEIKTSTPYISFGGYDYEWQNEGIRLSAKYEIPSQIDLSLS